MDNIPFISPKIKKEDKLGFKNQTTIKPNLTGSTVGENKIYTDGASWWLRQIPKKWNLR